MIMKKSSFLFLGFFLLSLSGVGQTVMVHVTNPVDLNRRDLAEFPAKEVYAKLGVAQGTPILVKNADGVEVPSQLTYDGLLLVQSMAHPLETERYEITVGQPQKYRNDVSGRVYPERRDDLGWENDRNAWRLYGPDLRRDNPHGIDCFTKNQPAPSLDSLYQGLFKNKVSYHEDHGFGMDAYTVGPTLGCGAPALMRGDSLLYSIVYDEVEILDNGPLRFTARLTYRHEEGFTETRLIRQDRGSHLVRCEVTYKGISGKTDIVSGLVVHKDNPHAYIINKKNQYVAYADNISSPKTRNGQLYVACLYPEKMSKLEYLPLEKEVSMGIGHVIGRKPYTDGETFVYYFGSGWSGYDVPSMNVWESLLKDYKVLLQEPLKVDCGVALKEPLNLKF